MYEDASDDMRRCVSTLASAYLYYILRLSLAKQLKKENPLHVCLKPRKKRELDTMPTAGSSVREIFFFELYFDLSY